MKSTIFLIRLDDACPTMDKSKWLRFKSITDKYGIKPLIGIIPNNQDKKQMIDPEGLNFWEMMKEWERSGYDIALHGYDHVYISKESGINPFWNKSEFAGVKKDIQIEKIRHGYKILKEHGLKPIAFFAPSHTFDLETVRAILSETPIRIISDTISLHPYKSDGMVFVPQISGHCVNFPIGGTFTFCFHPNIMGENDFKKLDAFLSRYKDKFSSFSQLNLDNVGELPMMDKIIRYLFFLYRKVRSLK